MEIVPIHYKISRPVKAWKEIKDEANELITFIDFGFFRGAYNKAFAIAHCQVSETPMAFFVLSKDVVAQKMFEHQVIINPEILEAPTHTDYNQDKDGNQVAAVSTTNPGYKLVMPNSVEYQEPCLSFPFRKPKRIVRYDRIKVRYQIPNLLGLKTVERWLDGIASEIFQHEYDHTIGKNIFFESEAPVKWWELIGQDRSKYGTSLDNADELGLKRAQELPVSGELTTTIKQ